MTANINQTQEIIAKISKYLPNIRPLQNFLHLNMYPDLLDHDFFEVLFSTANYYANVPFPEIGFYQKKFHANEIDRTILESIIDQYANSPEENTQLLNNLFREIKSFHIPEKGHRPIHRFISEELGQSINELSEPIIIRFLAGYFDQGLSHWNMPENQKTMLECFLQLNLQSWIPIYPLRKKLLRELASLDTINIIHTLLNKMITDPKQQEIYLESCVTGLKGWAGMIKTLQNNPSLLIDKRQCHLYDFIAIRMIVEYAWIICLKPALLPLKTELVSLFMLDKQVTLNQQEFLLFKIWQEAYEKSLIMRTLTQLASHHPNPSKPKDIESQILFCIDDRECLLRRQLETVDKTVQTFGTPGHFGLDFMYKDSHFSYPVKSCPAPVEAKFLIKNKRFKKKLKYYRWQNSQNQNVLSDVFITFTEGIFSIGKLFINTFLPYSAKIESPVKIVQPKELDIFNEQGGYDHQQAADRVAGVLKSIHLIDNFSQIVVALAHTSTTSNNPYYSAYGCGACSGRSGEINSSVFAFLLNDLKVREILKQQYQITIPASTTFIAGLHDTCSDEIKLYVPKEYRSHHLLLKIKQSLESALKKCAIERINDFALTDKTTDASLALQQLKQRSRAIFEPRPELGHTNNAFCFIGDRDNSRQFSFERRAFLQSYYGLEDGTGEILEGILCATFPVCGGISLDYLFSRMNNRHIGAGSKLSHNVTGLFGLAHGTEDDLLTGIANQMVELHNPVRITFIIEQNPDILKLIFSRNAQLEKWVKYNWVHLVCRNPVDKETYYYHQSQFKKIGEVIPC
jgi:uncharacterized protein YbcC (UPF0753/DUF2309 family)